MLESAKPAPLLDKPLVVTGHMVTFDPPGAQWLWAGSEGGDERAGVPGPDGPAQPHRLQLPAAVDRAGPYSAVDLAGAVAARPGLQASRQLAGQCALQRRRQGGP